MDQEFAFVTGGASGLGRATARMLAARNIQVFIADRDARGAEAVAKEVNGKYGVVDVADWNSQKAVFEQAVASFGRIDYVFAIAGIGEKKFLPLQSAEDGYQKPDLSVLDVNVDGLIYTVSLAVQQFRRQQPGKHGFRGKIGCAGSVCGVYCCSSVPLYTASKHAVTGFIRTLGKQLMPEKITLNSVNPNVMRTAFSTDSFYDMLDKEGLLTPLEGAVAGFEAMLGDSDMSGECWEIGPNYANGQGLVRLSFTECEDEKQRQVFDKLEARGPPK